FLINVGFLLGLCSRWRHTFTLRFLLSLNTKITKLRKKKNLNTRVVHDDDDLFQKHFKSILE
ncbi:hypothetical protein LDENG_00151350, partial [Lucifuga dentata]